MGYSADFYGYKDKKLSGIECWYDAKYQLEDGSVPEYTSPEIEAFYQREQEYQLKLRTVSHEEYAPIKANLYLPQILRNFKNNVLKGGMLKLQSPHSVDALLEQNTTSFLVAQRLDKAAKDNTCFSEMHCQPEFYQSGGNPKIQAMSVMLALKGF